MRIELQERALLYRVLEGTKKIRGLRHMEGVHVQCDNPDLTKRDFILPITFDNMDAASAAVELCKRGVYVYERVSTNHYSNGSLNPLGWKAWCAFLPSIVILLRRWMSF